MNEELTKAVEIAMTALSLVSTLAEKEGEPALMYGANRAWRIINEELLKLSNTKPKPKTNEQRK